MKARASVPANVEVQICVNQAETHEQHGQQWFIVDNGDIEWKGLRYLFIGEVLRCQPQKNKRGS